jgi:hypothetical protein
MDKLAIQLREDAEKIDAEISSDLDARLSASLQGIKPEPVRRSQRESKSFSLWWASSLTGVAAALLIIVVVNFRAPEPVPTAAITTPEPLTLPSVEWNAKSAVLTSPLEQEIDNLQSDLKKAEEVVKQDIDRLF